MAVVAGLQLRQTKKRTKQANAPARQKTHHLLPGRVAASEAAVAGSLDLGTEDPATLTAHAGNAGGNSWGIGGGTSPAIGFGGNIGAAVAGTGGGHSSLLMGD